MSSKYNWINDTLTHEGLFVCCDCGEVLHAVPRGEGIPYQVLTGYGLNADNDKVCYSCCANADKRTMRETGRHALYLTKRDNGTWKVSNWPGSFERSAHVKQGRHNIARVRYDAYFVFDGQWWHGVTYGDNTQICHVKRTKKAAGS